MNASSDLPASITPSSAPTPSARPFLLRAAITVSLASAVIYFVLLSLGIARISQGASRVLSIVITCACIAVPSIVLLTRISFRYTERFPRGILFMQAAVLIFTATVGTILSDLIGIPLGYVHRGTPWRNVTHDFPFNVVAALAIGLSISTFETLRFKYQAAQLEIRTRQVEQERANKLLAEARLSSLESRIHPHFLFNTLNSIAALIPRDPVRAEDTVSKLASLLRFSLNAQHASLVPLAQEMKIIRDYLEIESTRFGPRLRYEIDESPQLSQFKAPPLALQTIVENAIKHVAAQRPEGAHIRIAATTANGNLRLEVIDDGPGFSLIAITPEHGLGNVIARLDLLFGDRGKLDVTRRDNHTVVSLVFPAEN